MRTTKILMQVMQPTYKTSSSTIKINHLRIILCSVEDTLLMNIIRLICILTQLCRSLVNDM